jgi:hypothetical protein
MSVKNSKNICFIHIATLGNYQHIVDEILSYINPKDFSRIIANIAGEGVVTLPKEVEVISTRSMLTDFEFSTLNIIKQFCTDNKTLNVLYIHTKGASNTNMCIDEWRQYMLYFNLTNVPNIERILESTSACGVDLVNEPVLHFSGNFWWATAEHINNLKHPRDIDGIFSERHKCEFWICSNPNSKYTSLHNSNINVYQRHLTRYPKEKYEKNIN